jgi:hypothetical protein
MKGMYKCLPIPLFANHNKEFKMLQAIKTTISSLFYRLWDVLFVSKPKECTRCQPDDEPKSEVKPPSTHLKMLSGISATIMFEEMPIGTAYNLSVCPGTENKPTLIKASSLVFQYHDLDRLFMNGVVDPNGQKDGFAMRMNGSTLSNAVYLDAGLSPMSVVVGAYLIDGQKPMLTTYRGEGRVWVNGATLETTEPIRNVD